MTPIKLTNLPKYAIILYVYIHIYNVSIIYITFKKWCKYKVMIFHGTLRFVTKCFRTTNLGIPAGRHLCDKWARC